jgi:hypothetical protein
MNKNGLISVIPHLDKNLTSQNNLCILAILPNEDESLSTWRFRMKLTSRYSPKQAWQVVKIVLLDALC